MDSILDCYFDNVFVELPRSGLLSRQKRTELTEYFVTVIEACTAAGECESVQDGCKTAVVAAIAYHESSKNDNGGVCRMGKFHDVLYLGIKISFDFRLNDSKVIGKLLSEIFECEKTFERISAGAVFGVRVTHFIAGWKSDFNNQEENLQALLYFAEHAAKGRLTFEGKRFLDVPLTSCPSTTSVLQISLQLGRPEIFLQLVQNGSNVLQLEIESFFNQLLNEPIYSTQLILCFKYLLRGMLSIEFLLPTLDNNIVNPETGEILDARDRLILDGLLPSTRCGRKPIELKHICRFQIRTILWNNWQLPFGIWLLPLPQSLRDYLNLSND